MLKKLFGCNLNDQNAIYKNLHQFFIVALILILIDLFIIIVYTQLTHIPYYLTIRKIMMIYHIFNFIVASIFVLFYFIKGFYIAYKQRKKIGIYLFHTLFVTMITITLSYLLFLLLIVSAFS